jgi:hypothetical protein
MAATDPAHTLNNGRSSKGPDSSCIPLCRYHHDEMDGRLSIRVTTKIQFAAKYGLNLAEESAAHYTQYLLMKEKTESLVPGNSGDESFMKGTDYVIRSK